MEGKISFGFKKAVPSIGGSVPKASTSTLPARSSLFDDDDDDNNRIAQESTKKKGKKDKSSLIGVAGSAPLSRSAKARTEEALNVDSSVFDYDGVYDSMKVGEREAMKLREEEKKKRDPKYISAFLESSQQRKIDRTRAEAKMIQREREAEGEEFKDTEMFVTDAYKEQMEEIRKAEEKEKQKEETERSKSKGVAGFYKNFMEEKDRAHQAAVAASLQVSKDVKVEVSNGKQNRDEAAETNAVEEARKRGLNVRLNDDNEVVDERSLLSAGLNTFGKKKASDVEESRAEQGRGYRAEQSAVKRDGAREAREAREAQRQRQSKMIEEQMLELERKREEEAKQELEEQRKALVKERRNDQSSVESAKQRALERKRKREQEQSKGGIT